MINTEKYKENNLWLYILRTVLQQCWPLFKTRLIPPREKCVQNFGRKTRREETTPQTSIAEKLILECTS